jgi:DNA repair photolyase
MEPRAAAPHRRIETNRRLTNVGVPTTVMVAPIVPVITDREIEAILEEAAKAGAVAAGYVILRLPREIKDLFREWLSAHFPDRRTRVMSLVKQMRGGLDYDPEWFKRQKGAGPYAKLIADRFNRTVRRLGLNKPSLPLDVSQFRRPLDYGEQQELFGDDAWDRRPSGPQTDTNPGRA